MQNVLGIGVQKIVTDFGEISLVLDRYADTKTILTVDLAEVQIAELIGYSYSEEYLNSEVRRYMEECLFENEHITGVQDLEVSQIKDVLHIKFTLVTDVGSKEVEMDV